MAGSSFVEWNEVVNTNEGSSNSDKIEYLRLESGKTYRVRPIFRPIRFYKYFHKHNNKLRTAICEDPDTCPVKDKYPDLKRAAQRYACFVLDRADGKLKIIEAPASVFRPIGNRAEITGKNPGSGKDGSDWVIKVSGSGLKTKYDVSFFDVTPLTQEEREYVQTAVGGDQESLKKFYAIDTPEKIEQKLFGDAQDNSEGKNSENEKQTASASSDDEFNF